VKNINIMAIINNEGEELECIYHTRDRWDEDINLFIKDEFQYLVMKESPTDLMDKVFAPLLNWYFESQKGDPQAKEIY